MEPIVFGECFGWLHRATSSCGVVLCNPFGYDALCTHRGMRRLADQLAQQGLHVLRFDYPGAGDSGSREDDPGRVDAWLDSIDAAIDTLRERTGVTEIALCGFRLGALLAARTAQRRNDISALALLAPVVSGRQYVRELRAHRQRWLTTPAGFSAEPLPEDANYVEAYGFGVHGDDVAQLAGIDLLKSTTFAAPRVLLLDSVDRTRVAALGDAYRALGSEVEIGLFDECDKFLLEALYSETPQQAFDTVTQWLAKDMAATAPVTPAKDAPAILRLTAQALSETPVSFDVVHEPGRYFGIHCVPDRLDPELPAVLFCNTGASHHVGDGRMFVLFARRLAQLGMASLRMDLAGLGDSTPLSKEVTLDTIYSDASRDGVVAGAQWLSQHGYRRVVVFGVCGGAFNGLHAAALHPALIGCVSVNLQKFIWDGEDRAPGTPVFAQSRLYWRSAFSLGKWLEALQGKANPLRAARAVTQRAWRRVRARAGGALTSIGGGAHDTNPIRSLMRRVAAKGVQTRLIYGEFDVGLEELKIHFGTHGSDLRRYPSIRVLLLPKLDHALFTGVAREAVMRDTEAWLTQDMREAPPEAAPNRASGTRRKDRAHSASAFGLDLSAVAVKEGGSGRQSDTAPPHAHLPGVGS